MSQEDEGYRWTCWLFQNTFHLWSCYSLAVLIALIDCFFPIFGWWFVLVWFYSDFELCVMWQYLNHVIFDCLCWNLGVKIQIWKWCLMVKFVPDSVTFFALCNIAFVVVNLLLILCKQLWNAHTLFELLDQIHLCWELLTSTLMHLKRSQLFL